MLRRRYSSASFQWRMLAAAAIMLALLSMAALLWSTSFGVTPLGDPSAQRPHNQQVAQRQAEPNAAIPQPYTEEERARYTQQIVAAFNCMHEQHGQPALTLDAALSARAEELWQAQSVDRSAADQAAQAHVIVSIMALDWMQPASGCSVGGYDAGALPAVEATTIGVTVHAPLLPGGVDGPSAVVLVGR